ncbi:MAG: hypothetical protein COU08_00120 [Candidatus Harrisonbacteria bacterium CG10_big_fil_rev_8_21_14_0_10_42_17]|uniref:Cohesin domain-containing protein n=1 Tax=Candidatus Harrisonbacteria bacterium CG10_big_fil_rev_8_21_14_0_10_42_17 TaxID=1974584 RepID=A0A2M6WJF9_9BACT|nr:MAG: hypothetical protein COU08_00120 [Candidatus Harrisonbacteria bacterium CG10_big_fil_rev_8_21_14_0_10_42_17]
MKIGQRAILVFLSLLFLISAKGVLAASIYILPEQENYERGAEFDIDLKIDSEGESINAAEARIKWPSSVLEFISINKGGSVFNFWVEEPELSIDSRSVYFIGGTAKGISGGSLQIFKIRFKAISGGIADISIADAAVTGADGKGTNVLSKTKGGSFGIGVGVIQPRVSEPATPEAQQPVLIERPAVLSARLPQKPEISVPLYVDQAKWQNHLGEIVALWDVPEDVTRVSVTLDQSPNTIPVSAEKELFTGKKFGILKEGVHYIHARFRNNIGWGPVAHYRIAIDVTPPLGFEIYAIEGEATDNPTPIIQFETSDALSGIAEYQIKIDDEETLKIKAGEFSGDFTLPLQVPGAHKIVITAFDQAGNSVADDINLEILPIPSPSITFITRELFSEEETGLVVKGTALSSVHVILQVQQLLRNDIGEMVAKEITIADEKGNWEFTFAEPLRNGRYVVSAKSQDARGALSLAITSQEIRVKNKPIIQIGFFQLGLGETTLFLLLILVAGFGGGVWFYRRRREKLALRVGFTESEITKIFKLIREDVELLSKAYQTPTPGDEEYAMKRLRENIQKMEVYLKKGVEKIKQ